MTKAELHTERLILINALQRALFVMDSGPIRHITNGGGCVDYIKAILAACDALPDWATASAKVR